MNEIARRTRKAETPPSWITTSCRTTSAIRRSRTDLAAVSTARLNHELKQGAQPTAAFTSGLSWALTACAIAVACAAVIALRTRNVHSEAEAEALGDVEELVTAR